QKRSTGMRNAIRVVRLASLLRGEIRGTVAGPRPPTRALCWSVTRLSRHGSLPDRLPPVSYGATPVAVHLVGSGANTTGFEKAMGRAPAHASTLANPGLQPPTGTEAVRATCSPNRR